MADSSKTPRKVTMHTFYNSVSPRPGHRYGEEISWRVYEQDMAQNREWGEVVNVWTGQARDGSPLTVAWLTQPRHGMATLYAYEISGSE